MELICGEKEQGKKFVCCIWPEFARNAISGEVQNCRTAFCKIPGICSVYYFKIEFAGFVWKIRPMAKTEEMLAT